MMHSEIQEAIPLLALGGSSQAEQAQLEQHLAVCPACRALLAEYSFVAHELDAQVPARELPAQLESKILQQLPKPNAHASRSTPRADPLTRPPGYWRQPVRISRWTFALGILSMLLLLGAAAALAFQLQRSGASNTTIVSPAGKLENLKVVELTGGVGTIRKPTGYICLQPESQTAMLWLSNLEPLDWDHTYQLWLMQSGQRISGGLFRPNNNGRAAVMVNAPQPWAAYQEIGVTVEPEGGSMGPTTPRVIGGKLD